MDKVNEVDGPQLAVDQAAVLVSEYDPTNDEENPALFKEK
jgi:hypothetical protein